MFIQRKYEMAEASH